MKYAGWMSYYGAHLRYDGWLFKRADLIPDIQR